MAAVRRALRGLTHGHPGLVIGGCTGIVGVLAGVAVWFSVALLNPPAVDPSVTALSTTAAQARIVDSTGATGAGSSSAYISTGGKGESLSVSKSDVDGDGISNALELKTCGSLTCAERWTDTDRDSIPDFVEARMTGTSRLPTRTGTRGEPCTTTTTPAASLAGCSIGVT